MESSPLLEIFKVNSNSEIIPEIKHINKICYFFEYIKSSQIGLSEKIEILDKLTSFIKENRYISEYFSSFNNKSIYIYLFDLYINKNSTIELKTSIINLISQLRINIQTNKDIYEYLFSKLSLIYRGETQKELLYDILSLLNCILGDTINSLKPRNYFAFSGEGRMFLDLSKKQIEIGYCFTFILNFKTVASNNFGFNNNLCNLIKIKFKNEKIFSIDLKYPVYFIYKNKVKKTLPSNEWINLIITCILTKNGELETYVYATGENLIKPLIKSEKLDLTNTEQIESIEFFNNFYGEVSSIVMLSQKEEGKPGVNTNKFLVEFQSNPEGLWKRKKFEDFLKFLSKIKSIDKEKLKQDQKKNKKNLNEKNLPIKQSKTFKETIDKKFDIEEIENGKTLKDNIVFIFTSFNYIDTYPNIVEDYLGNFKLIFNGNIRSHKYQCFQKKLDSVCYLNNLLPIGEIFLKYPQLLNEKNFELFLKIIENILSFRSNNIISTKKFKFFRILSLFIEKYPKNLFTEKILDSFANIGKTMFSDNKESLCKFYFKYILLNEKILAKYNGELLIKFWNYIMLFCQSDSTQISTFINMNQISLILRFYDRKKYKQMCCEKHLNMFKPEFIKENNNVMKPNMSQKLSYIKDILDMIVDTQDASNSIHIFKLLTLDLSPCLTIFIINIFNNAFDKRKEKNSKWEKDFINQLIINNYEVIIFNTFIHSLPDVKLEILRLIFQIYIRIDQKNRETFTKFETVIRKCLLPKYMFYAEEPQLKEKNENLLKNGSEDEKKIESEIINDKNEKNNQNNEEIEKNKEDKKTEVIKNEEKSESNELKNTDDISLKQEEENNKINDYNEIDQNNNININYSNNEKSENDAEKCEKNCIISIEENKDKVYENINNNENIETLDNVNNNCNITENKDKIENKMNNNNDINDNNIIDNLHKECYINSDKNIIENKDETIVDNNNDINNKKFGNNIIEDVNQKNNIDINNNENNIININNNENKENENIVIDNENKIIENNVIDNNNNENKIIENNIIGINNNEDKLHENNVIDNENKIIENNVIDNNNENKVTENNIINDNNENKVTENNVVGHENEVNENNLIDNSNKNKVSENNIINDNNENKVTENNVIDNNNGNKVNENNIINDNKENKVNENNIIDDNNENKVTVVNINEDKVTENNIIDNNNENKLNENNIIDNNNENKLNENNIINDNNENKINENNHIGNNENKVTVVNINEDKVTENNIIDNNNENKLNENNFNDNDKNEENINENNINDNNNEKNINENKSVENHITEKIHNDNNNNENKFTDNNITVNNNIENNINENSNNNISENNIIENNNNNENTTNVNNNNINTNENINDNNNNIIEIKNIEDKNINKEEENTKEIKPENYEENNININENINHKIDIINDNNKDNNGENDNKDNYINEKKSEKNNTKTETNNINTNIQKNAITKKKDTEDSPKGILIIKDEVYKEYIEQLFEKVLIWSLGIRQDIPISFIQIDTIILKHTDLFEILFTLNDELNMMFYTQKLLNTLKKMINLENSYLILYDKKIFSKLLSICFQNYDLYKSKNNKDKEINKECFSISKQIIIDIYIKSLTYVEIKSKNNENIYPSTELETIFIWGDKLLTSQLTRSSTGSLYSFLDELLYDLLISFKVSFEEKMKFSINEVSNNLTKKYYFNNYLIFITKLYHYCFQYRLDTYIYKNGLSVLCTENTEEVVLPHVFIYSMQIDSNKGNSINDTWMNYKYIYEIYHRVSFIWSNENVYKNNYEKKIKNKNKFTKYKNILDVIILNKSKKNLYQNELGVLFYQLTFNINTIKNNKITNKNNNNNQVNVIDDNITLPIIKIMQIFFMCIISLLLYKKEENELKTWLKEYKKFLRFIIIATSNLTLKDKKEFYEKTQEKSLYIITAGICFLNYIFNQPTIYKNEIEKVLVDILMLVFFIIKHSFDYGNRHKKNKYFLISTKSNRNDLSSCAIILMFNTYMSNILNYEKLENILSDKNFYNNILEFAKEIKETFFNNKNLKNDLNTKYFCVADYKKIVDYRFEIINTQLNEVKENDYSNFTKKILELLPTYQKELIKYSTNSLEKNINNKNLYKKIKKNLFSWNGYWSDKSIFYNNDNYNTEKQSNKNFLKYKLINHYTKNFMRPILKPILDIPYYLPDFTGFDKNLLFRDDYKKIVDIDIDKNNIDIRRRSFIIENIKEEFDLSPDNYLRNIYTKSNIELSEKLKKISNILDLGKEEDEEFDLKEENTKTNKEYFLCCLVKTSHHIKGVCFIDENKLNFKVFLDQKTGNSMDGINIAFTDKDEDYDPERKTCYGSYFMFHHKDKDLYKISIDYDDIKWIFRRRYYYKNSGMEIFTTTNKIFYFNFKYEDDRELVIKNILKKLKEYHKIIDNLKNPKDSFNNIIGFLNVNSKIYEKEFKKDITLKKILKNWKKWKISNFEFLMWLNIFSNRSYNDLSQYPIFPWIFSKYEDPLKKTHQRTLSKISINTNNFENQEEILDYEYRELNLPMGMLEINQESIKRKELFLESYDTLKNESEEFENMKPYFYGSNYSNPIYVCNYLVRIFPFTHISIELQGSKFDDPNRLFFSVKNSFENSISQKTDLRELIPEFFYLPEMFQNINNINFGQNDEGKNIDDVETPCEGNPYQFVENLKIGLENNHLSENLRNWIDLIFGYKAKGKEAENAKNIFTEASYQEDINLNKIEDKNSYLRLVEFGLIPTQVMSNECPKRVKKEVKGINDPFFKYKFYKCKRSELNDENNIIEDKNINYLNNEQNIINSYIYNGDRLFLLFNDSFIIKKVSGFLDSFSEEILSKEKIKTVPNKISEFYKNNNIKYKLVVFYNQGKNFISCGYYDSYVIIFFTQPQKNSFKITPFKEEEPILSLCIDKTEKFLFIGNKIGNIVIYKIGNEQKDFQPIYSNADQKFQISHINCNNELNLWSSLTINGYLNIYTMPTFKLVRSIKVNCENCIYAFLSASPLPSIIIICEEDDQNSKFFSYSINGKLLEEESEDCKINNPIIINDINFSDYLVYISKNSDIVIRSLPFLEISLIIKDLNNITNICFNEEKRFLVAIDGNDNSQVYVIKNE